MAATGTRTRNIFDPHVKEPFKISRSKIELFLECSRCFYLDRRCGIGRPSGPAFTLNIAVDALLKKEFDVHRKKSEAHPLMHTYGVHAVPFAHPDLATWRDNFKGIQFLHDESNFIITGAVDDVWIDDRKELIVVDYKATSTAADITLDGHFGSKYKRQMEVYQWLYRQNGFHVSDTGYFVNVNADKDKEAFDKTLEFSVQLIAYTGNADWIPEALSEMKLCLVRDLPPPANPDCEWCAYRRAAVKKESAS